MKPIGLTGNIGCGKSTVASLLSKYQDVTILDCDFIAKDIIANGAYAKKSMKSWQQTSLLEKKLTSGRWRRSFSMIQKRKRN